MGARFARVRMLVGWSCLLVILGGCHAAECAKYTPESSNTPALLWSDENLRRPVDSTTAAFNPGLDPLHLQRGDSLYRPTEKERALYARCGGDIWMAEEQREFKADIDGDGENERIVCSLLKTQGEPRRFEREPEGRGILRIMKRGNRETWVRRATFAFEAPVRQVNASSVTGGTLLQVNMPSAGATSSGSYAFLMVPNDLARVHQVQFVNGFMNGKQAFTTCGSAGYGLHVRTAEDKQALWFRKYETMPVRALSEAEYRLEHEAKLNSRYAFVLVREERLPLDRMNQDEGQWSLTP